MKKIKKIEKEIIIDELNVSDEIKNNLNDFKMFISRLKKNNYKKYNNYFNIIIDNTPLKDIDIYLEYITKILINEKFANDVKDFSRNISKNTTNKIIIYNIKNDFDVRINSEEIVDNLYDYNNKKNILIITSYEKIEDIDSYYKFNNIIETTPFYRISHKHEEENIYNNLLEKYQERKIKIDISKENFTKIYESINSYSYTKKYDTSEYLYNYSIINNSISNKECITMETFDSLVKDENEKVEKVEKKNENKININSLTGLSNIKEELNTLFNYIEFKKKINSKDTTYLNLFFLGNPGTGKTMVASIISSKLYEMGYLTSDEIIKVIPTDLIAEYVGQTKNKIRNILNKAEGKLLFIDEAYLMYNSNYKKGNNPFMEEAIVELMKYLEDPKNIVIFAGYTKEMRKLYDVNPGLKSRIYKEIEFSDYTKDELYKILSNDLKKQGLTIEKTNKKDIMNYINYLKKDKNFGNARSMLKLSQELIMNHANSKIDTLVITKDDLPKYQNNIKEMGF